MNVRKSFANVRDCSANFFLQSTVAIYFNFLINHLYIKKSVLVINKYLNIVTNTFSRFQV